MSTIALDVLVERLDEQTQQCIEQALSLAVRMQHSSVMPVHLFITLLRSQAWWRDALLQNAVDVSAMESRLQIELRDLIAVPETVPTISQDVVDWLGESWLLASLTYGAASVSPLAMVLTLLQDAMLRQHALRLMPECKSLSLEWLRDQMRHPVVETAVMTQASCPKQEWHQYTVDVTAQAEQGGIDPVVGRDAETEQLIDVLLRRRQNNPLLLGEPGVGKTAVVEGLARRVVAGDVPEALKHVRIYALDLALLQAGASVKGEFERRLTQLIQAVESHAKPILLFIDEAHSLIGAGNAAGQGDAANILKPALARGALRTIAATTWREYKKYIETDPALVRRFQPVKIAEPCEGVAIEMLKGVVPALKAHHDVDVHESALIAAVRLSDRYIAERQLPDKAIGVLDTAMAKRAKSQQDDVTIEDVAAVIHEWTGIPKANLLLEAQDRVMTLGKQLQQRVLGQDRAIKMLVNSVQTRASGLAGHDKPAGVVLLVGPSGVGKTETALALADALYGGEQSITMVNMSEYKEVHKVATLTGSPPGYIGYGEGGVLTEAVRRQPYSLVLLDEMEKAHPSVQDVFYHVFDKGMLQDSEGRWVDFKNTMMVMTSNAASDFIANYDFDGDDDRFMRELTLQLQQDFKPAFLGRVTVVPYRPLSSSLMQKIIDLQLRALQQRTEQLYGVKLTVSSRDVESIAGLMRRPQIGAREAKQWISQQVMPVLAKKLLAAKKPKRIALASLLPGS